MSTTSQASQRINALLDENSFVEIGALVTARATDFNLKQAETPSDGVVTGYGVIDGNLVYVYSQDASVLNGTVGEMHAKKIANLYDLALKTGAPVIGLIDSAGLRLQEATDALNGFGEIYMKQALASGVIPQITAVFGSCGGGLALIPAMTDFAFMEEKKAKLFVNSPNALEGNEISRCDTSSAAFQSEETGMVDAVGDEASIMAQIRQLVSMLPANNAEIAVGDCTDDLNRACAQIVNCVGDTSIALSQIADDGIFVEVKQNYAKDMVAGFIRLNGATIGAVANRTEVYNADGEVTDKFDAALSVRGAEKAAGFVNFCDAFDIPVLSLTNVAGFAATKCSESRIAKAVGKLTYAFANATVPKVNVITGEAFGSAYVAMNSKHIGADLVLALEGAKVGVMDAKVAAQIMYEDEISKEKDTNAALEKKAKEFDEMQCNVNIAAKRGYVDNVIEGAQIRKQLIYAMQMFGMR